MLRKIAAVLLLVGICLPYSCDVRPVTGAWTTGGGAVAAGIPLLALVAWCLDALLGALLGFTRRMPVGEIRAARRVVSVIFIVVTGWLLVMAFDNKPKMVAIQIGAVAITAAFLNVLARRGDRTGQIAPWLLAVAGVSEAAFLAGLFPGELQVGGWILAAGFVLAIVAEWRETAGGPAPGEGGLPSRGGAG